MRLLITLHFLNNLKNSTFRILPVETKKRCAMTVPEGYRQCLNSDQSV